METSKTADFVAVRGQLDELLFEYDPVRDLVRIKSRRSKRLVVIDLRALRAADDGQVDRRERVQGKVV